MPCGNAIVGHQPYGLVPSSLLTPSVSSVNDTIMYASPDSSTSSYQQLPSVSSSMAGAHGSIASSIEAGGGGSATKVPLPRLPRTQSANNGDGAAADAASEPSSSKKKQKRNKPTLSCHECVERKTKVSR